MKPKLLLYLAFMLRFSTLVVFVALVMAQNISAAQSQWVYFDSNGKLAYKTLPDGDRIMDFSYAGYMGGGVKIPGVPAVKTVSPSGDDDTMNIQSAIDEVSQMPLADGFRGAVLLKPGIFNCSGTLDIKAGGIVLRGSGPGPSGTTIKMTGEPHMCISVKGTAPQEIGSSVKITDRYVPLGAVSVNVADASSFNVGDAVLVHRPTTDAWVEFMGMNDLVRYGKLETWVSGNITTRRNLKAISGNTVTLDVPLSDSLDSKYLNPDGAVLVKCSLAGQISQIGVENLHIFAPPQSITITQKQYQAISMDNTSDSWLRSVAVDDTINSIYCGHDARRITLENVMVNHSVSTKGAALPADFTADGTQILLNHCSGYGNHLFYFVTLNGVTGPNVLLNCDFRGDGHIQPHVRWATGLLVDNCHVPGGGIDLMNRGIMGTGHGWTVGWGVIWNCSAKSFIIQQPPGSANWAIGCIGKQEHSTEAGSKTIPPQGFIDSDNNPVAPKSLYLEQLRERLGDQAVANVNY